MAPKASDFIVLTSFSSSLLCEHVYQSLSIDLESCLGGVTAALSPYCRLAPTFASFSVLLVCCVYDMARLLFLQLCRDLFEC